PAVQDGRAGAAAFPGRRDGAGLAGPLNAPSMRFAEFDAVFHPISGIKLCKTPRGKRGEAGEEPRGKRGPREGCPEGSRGSRGSSEDAMQWHSARTPGNAELSVRRAKQAQRGSYSEEHQVF